MNLLSKSVGYFRRRQPAKVFCVGFNKTGTTSVEKALQQLDYRTGNQAQAELLIHDWARRDFRRIIEYCESADAFQDIPFSFDFTYVILDHAFPGSKFILTVRDDPEQWYTSLTRFHTKIVGKQRLPTAADLKDHPYRYPGWLMEVLMLMFDVEEAVPYDKQTLISCYERHNLRVLDYFRHRMTDLLVLNLSQPESMKRLCEFLTKPYFGQAMPRLNASY